MSGIDAASDHSADAEEALGTDPIPAPSAGRSRTRMPEPVVAGPAVCREGQVPRRQVILLAGPSGSGKSHLTRSAGIPLVYLDDFYKAGSDPSCPRDPNLGIVDWDDPRSWNMDAAMQALIQLCTEGQAQMPLYDISTDRPKGTRTLRVGEAPFVAEGLFAPLLYRPCEQAGILLDAIVVHRNRWKNLVRRAARDLKERRKPPTTILRRGIGLYRREDVIVGRALRAGFRSLDAEETRQALTAWRVE